MDRVAALSCNGPDGTALEEPHVFEVDVEVDEKENVLGDSLGAPVCPECGCTAGFSVSLIPEA